MNKSNIISATKANSIYWLGRYEERVYLTLHLLRKCYDRMIDGELEDYHDFWQQLDETGIYDTSDEFTLGMMYDEMNDCSIISAQRRALDNAILLREDIMSETLSYLEMSMARLKECKDKKEMNVTCLQPVIDWSLAFWGSAEQRIRNHKTLYLMMIGRNVENIDILIRFGYDFQRVLLAYDSLMHYCRMMPNLVDDHIEEQINEMLLESKFNLKDAEYKFKLLKFLNQMVRV